MKHHRYFGLVLAFFLLMFSVSGIVLNHPSLFSHINVGRNLLPKQYSYNNWNNGLFRGTIKWRDKVLLYGNAGVWLTDSTAKAFMDFNKGMPHGVDHRNIRGMAIVPSGEVFAAGQYGLFRLDGRKTWQAVELGLLHDDRISDIATRGDTLVVTTRSQVFVARAPYRTFQRIELALPDGDAPRFSVFRTIWWLHSGELFGIVGKLVVDAIASCPAFELLQLLFINIHRYGQIWSSYRLSVHFIYNNNIHWGMVNLYKIKRIFSCWKHTICISIFSVGHSSAFSSLKNFLVRQRLNSGAYRIFARRLNFCIFASLGYRHICLF